MEEKIDKKLKIFVVVILSLLVLTVTFTASYIFADIKIKNNIVFYFL